MSISSFTSRHHVIYGVAVPVNLYNVFAGSLADSSAVLPCYKRLGNTIIAKKLHCEHLNCEDWRRRRLDAFYIALISR